MKIYDEAKAMATVSDREELFDLMESNIQKIGNKYYAFVPMELLYLDERYQRNDLASTNKINKLIKEWNPNKMDAIRVSIHSEEKLLVVIDGYHRTEAQECLKYKFIIAEIIFIKGTPEERLMEEARLFATQNDELDTLTPVEKHKANVLLGIKEYVELQEIIEKFKIPFKAGKGRGVGKIGELTGYTEALAICKAYGKELLEDVMDILFSARWNLATKGLGNYALRTVKNILLLHPEAKKEIKSEIINYFTPIDPDKFFASSMEKYPERKINERMTLYLEDYICEKLNLQKVYHGGKIISVISNIKIAQ